MNALLTPGLGSETPTEVSSTLEVSDSTLFVGTDSKLSSSNPSNHIFYEFHLSRSEVQPTCNRTNPGSSSVLSNTTDPHQFLDHGVEVDKGVQLGGVVHSPDPVSPPVPVRTREWAPPVSLGRHTEWSLSTRFL